eukprot:GHVP01061369.1.p1 GENE.GHVP01061369.1~~GHVP01061369.1.p1  ORF type:complete len:103 (+),score=20.71 GHVP01061369.1:45-311(+)
MSCHKTDFYQYQEMDKELTKYQENKKINFGKIEELVLHGFAVNFLRFLKIPEDNVVKKLTIIWNEEMFHQNLKKDIINFGKIEEIIIQ